MRVKFLLLLTGCLLAGGRLPADDYARQIEAARSERVDRLTRSDGWLTLIGRPALPPGASTIGRAADNRIVLEAGPDRFGTITFSPDGRVAFLSAAGAGVLVDGSAASVGVELHPGSRSRRPTFVTAGTVGFYLVESAGQKTLHVRDLAHPRLIDFHGLDYYPANPAWRFEAEWVALAGPRPVQINDIAGGVSFASPAGKAVFRLGGKSIELLPMANADGTLLFVFADATSGANTYAMRFLHAAPPREGKVILDFNLAENPPCAFSPVAVCPLPPAGNHLAFAVKAGEKIFRGSGH